MVFHDPRSLDVLTHQARELRTMMGGAKWAAEDSGNPGKQPKIAMDIKYNCCTGETFVDCLYCSLCSVC